jgi:CheY-like chemotaxis protein
MSDVKPRPRILVADDQKFFRLMLQELLTDQGFEVLEAEDGAAALEMIRREHATLSMVLLDLVMPVKDGADVLRAVRANPRTEQLPIILVTGQEVTPDQLTDLRAMGATAFLSKATPSKEMMFRVRSLVEEHVRRDAESAEGAPVNLMVDYLTGEGSFSALCFQLSERWLDLRTIRPQQVGASLTMSFDLPGATEPVQVRGKVIEERRSDAGPGGLPTGMRVEFETGAGEVLAEIRDFLKGRSRRA